MDKDKDPKPQDAPPATGRTEPQDSSRRDDTGKDQAETTVRYTDWASI